MATEQYRDLLRNYELLQKNAPTMQTAKRSTLEGLDGEIGYEIIANEN